MGQLFGTDGLRGRAGEFPLNEENVTCLGKNLVSLLQRKDLFPQAVVGWDTRESSPWLAYILTQAIKAAGCGVFLAGEIPTSAVSLLTRNRRLSAGIVISASHNPYEDNGIKIFQRDGYKLPDQEEEELERKMLAELSAGKDREKTEIKEGFERQTENSREQIFARAKETLRPEIDLSLAEEYMNFLIKSFASVSMWRGVRIAVDCANGAASSIAPQLFAQLGFKVFPLHNQPNGRNINVHCGSLYPENLAEVVKANDVDIGVAYDGDADRAIFVDEKGKILNGDHTLFILAKFMRQKRRLNSPVVVGTIMSNFGLEVALSRLGLKLVRTRVGDRFVLEEMLRQGANLGGERSGHTIFLDNLPTGDGLLTTLKMAEAMVETGKTLAELSADLVEFPQCLLNVSVVRRVDLASLPGFETTLNKIKDKLGAYGRIEVRYSGTEPVVRVMVEGEDEDLVRQSAEEIGLLIQNHLGG